MKLLVTTSRMPFAVEEIRMLGEEGHRVFAGDTYAHAPGSHSRYVARHFEYPSPRRQTADFVASIREIVAANGIEAIVPSFEEGFYLSEHRDDLPPGCELFAADFPALMQLHHKSSFLRLAQRLRLPVPETRVVSSLDEMREAMGHFGDYFARPVSSRGAIELLTNRGILRGMTSLETCRVSAARPWVIQPYVEGEEICTYTLARRGAVLAHVTYRHPLTLGDRGGIAFESVPSDATLPIAQAIAAETAYTGQLALDFIQTDGQLMVGECNPRATAGVSLMPGDVFARTVTGGPAARLFVSPAGSRRQIASGLILDALQNWKHVPRNVAAHFRFGDDVYAARGDLLPGLYSLSSFSQVRRFQRQMPEEARYDLADVVASQFYDVVWNDEAEQAAPQVADRPVAGVPAAVAPLR